MVKNTVDIDVKHVRIENMFITTGHGKKKNGGKPPQPDPQPQPEIVERTFDPVLNMWRKSAPAPARENPAPGRAAIPISDGSGIFWDLVDISTGFRLWRVEAWNWSAALDEKRRLTRLSRGCGRFVRIYRAA